MQLDAVIVRDRATGKVGKICPECRLSASDHIEGGPPFCPDQPDRTNYQTESGYLREVKRRTSCDRCRGSLKEI